MSAPPGSKFSTLRWPRYPVRRDYAILGLILLLATFLRLSELNRPGLWLDEASYTIAAQSPIIGQIVNPTKTLRLSADPVLSALPFSLALKLGFSNFAARFPAALFGILSIAVLYRLGRTLFGNGVGLIAALLLATSSFHIFYSQEARSYAQLTFFSLASFWFFYRAIHSQSLADWGLYALFTWAGISSHYVMVFSIVVQGVLVIALFLREVLQDGFQRTNSLSLRASGYFVSAIILIFLLRLPWLGDFRTELDKTVGGPYTLDLGPNLIDSIQALAGHSWLSSVLLLALTSFGLILILYKSTLRGLFMASWIILSIPITTVGLWYVSQFFHERYTLWVLPGLLLATGCGLAGIGHLLRSYLATKGPGPIPLQSTQLAEQVVVGLLLVPLVVVGLQQSRQNAAIKQAWPLGHLQAATDYLATEAAQGEAIIGVPTTVHLQLYLKPVRPDLIYLDAQTTRLPEELKGRWYVFFEAQHVPASWSEQLEVTEFADILIVYRPDVCQLQDCLNETAAMFAAIAQANPGSTLEEKVEVMLSGLTTLAAD